MILTEEQLSTWANPGAMVTAKATADSVRTTLKNSSRISSLDFEVYLQGSYKNDTNIRGDSDVDIVVQLNSTVLPDVSALPPGLQLAIQSTYPSATYQWGDFRRDVISALTDSFGANVQLGNNSVKLKGTSGRLPADIVPCLQYRKYNSTVSWIEGIYFYSFASNSWVVNYPKLHYENGVAKNGAFRTNGCYKPMVRVFKNARSYLVGQNIITSDLAPSYFLECLLHNVPDAQFGTSYLSTFVGVISSLRSRLNSSAGVLLLLDPFNCQNGQLLLFGDTPQQWSWWKAQYLIDRFFELRNGRY
jgi:hypothetical protein